MEDTFPTTNIEALACGTQVITYRTGGSIESIDKSCGVVVDRGNIDGIYKAIKVISQKTTNYKNCIEKAHNYDKSQKFNEYIKEYMEMCKDVRIDNQEESSKIARCFTN